MLQAAETYNSVAEKYHGSPVAPDSLVNSARCYRIAGNNGKAMEQYRRVLRDFPGSLIRVDAERYLAALDSGAGDIRPSMEEAAVTVEEPSAPEAGASGGGGELDIPGDDG